MNRNCVEDTLYALVSRLARPMVDDDLAREIVALADEAGIDLLTDETRDEIIDTVEIETLWERREQEIVDYFYDHKGFKRAVANKSAEDSDVYDLRVNLDGELWMRRRGTMQRVDCPYSSDKDIPRACKDNCQQFVGLIKFADGTYIFRTCVDRPVKITDVHIDEL